jgi:hypothetical protein
MVALSNLALAKIRVLILIVIQVGNNIQPIRGLLHISRCESFPYFFDSIHFIFNTYAYTL